MGFISVVKQKKKWSKTDCNKNIDLPTGVTFQSQKKKRKLFPKFFSSIFKSKYNAAIEATNNKLENSEKVVKFANSKFLNEYDPEETIHVESEKTVQSNNITYLKFPTSEVNDDYESTIGTVVSDEEWRSPTRAFLTRRTIDLKGRNSDTLPILSDDLAEIIRSRLPNLLQEATSWNLLYSMDQHGARLSTLYRNIQGQGPCVMVLRNSENELFGAFISEPFDPSNKGFFGTPECFLWKANKFQFKKFSATHLNQYFMLAESNFIAMGGGNGNFGFYLDEDIQYGYSSKSDTFENEVLTEDNEFECYGCEIWGLEF